MYYILSALDKIHFSHTKEMTSNKESKANYRIYIFMNRIFTNWAQTTIKGHVKSIIEATPNIHNKYMPHQEFARIQPRVRNHPISARQCTKRPTTCATNTAERRSSCVAWLCLIINCVYWCLSAYKTYNIVTLTEENITQILQIIHNLQRKTWTKCWTMCGAFAQWVGSSF